MRNETILAAALLGLAACPKQPPAAPEGANAAPVKALPPATVDETALDRRVDPCEDFYEFACGGWKARTEIPADRPAWYRGFSEIQQHNQGLLRAILDAAADGTLDAPYAAKLGAFWNTCMDESASAEASLRTLREAESRIAAIGDRVALARQVAALQQQGVAAFFEFGSQQDFRDTTQVIGGADQGGLALPDRDYYLRDDEAMATIRAAYLEHVAKMFELAGDAPEAAARQAKTVLELETALAQASMPRVDRRDPYKVYHRLEREGLEKLAPALAWDAYFAELGQAALTKINVATPGFFEALQDQLERRSLDELRTYLRWQLLHAGAPALPAPFEQEDFRFRSAHLTGEKQQLPRWKRCVDMVDRGMGHALARPYVEATFGAEGKERAQALIRGIERAFEENLGALAWMDEATREEAKKKLHAVYNKIGYPDRWRSYDGLELSGDSLLANVLAASRFEARRDLAKIGAPVDRDEWFMSPPTVNAYYHALLNEMVFPAGILQPPFFSAESPEAINAGAIGMVMGHELTHGFDDKGRRFDAEGNLRDWWSPKVSEAYEGKAQCVVDQYEGYRVLGEPLNGRLTLGENIADIGGLKLAWMAFEQASEGRALDEIAGFSPAQQFFLSYAQSWCSRRRDAYARTLLKTDPHSPPEYRVNGAVSNLPAFGEAFSCAEGAPMRPSNRCEVW